jgi:hypothetical protein
VTSALYALGALCGLAGFGAVAWIAFGGGVEEWQ